MNDAALRSPVVLVLILAAGCAQERSSPSVEVHATYVGRAECARCHPLQNELWTGSHHDLAMQVAADSTVLGDFQDAAVEWGGVTSTFFRRNGGFLVHTEGADGELHDFGIEHVFGVEPLQQYLVPFADGRRQALGLAWDARPDGQGGQRWYPLYPDENIPAGDVLHWTGSLQNWNSRCAECHSTNLHRNWSATEHRYETTWSEIDVSCEACHGPGSRHVEWAALPDGTRAGTDDGLTVDFSDPGGGAWELASGESIAHRKVPREGRAQLETCAPCHSRRSPIASGPIPGAPLEDTHRLSLLREGLYHADGQILDEVYVYGSFLQSRMHAKGVVCTDCHDPHTAELSLPGDLSCSKCHRSEVYAAPSHHFHPPASKGASCIACHMPSRTYMVVDERHDHSFRVPRPDLTEKIGTPNACNDCHSERTSAWAAAEIEKRFGPRETHWGEAIAAGRAWAREAPSALRAVAANDSLPGIVRATAIHLLGERLGPVSLAVVERAIDDADELVRRSALGALAGAEPGRRARLAAKRIDDSLLSVRLEATRLLAEVPERTLPADVVAALEPALDEYRESQRANDDLPEAWLNLAWLHAVRGEASEAEAAYRTARRISPRSARLAVNHADFCRAQGRDAEGERILRDALEHAPDDADLQHALGLLLVRSGRKEEALAALARAAVEGQAVPRYAFVHAIALRDVGRADEALDVLHEAHERFPGHPDLLAALASVSRAVGREKDAARWARRADAVRAEL